MAPVISGSPPVSVVQDRDYAFTPVASDADGDTLTFAISNQPAWADFDSSDGTLTGTPGAADVGATTAVAMSVSDGEASASLAPFDLEVLPAVPGTATVSWAAPTTNADGSALEDLAGFYVHYGTASGDYTWTVDIDDPSATRVTIDDLAPGTWFFAVTAVDESGNESDFSTEVSKEIVP